MRFRMVWRADIPISLFPHYPPTAIVNRAGARMPRLSSLGAAMLMTRAAVALCLFLVVPAATAHAQTTAGCTVTNVNIVAQDLGDVTITCTALSEEFGKQ